MFSRTLRLLRHYFAITSSLLRDYFVITSSLLRGWLDFSQSQPTTCGASGVIGDRQEREPTTSRRASQLGKNFFPQISILQKYQIGKKSAKKFLFRVFPV
jgi:hypothetical protein